MADTRIGHENRATDVVSSRRSREDHQRPLGVAEQPDAEDPAQSAANSASTRSTSRLLRSCPSFSQRA